MISQVRTMIGNEQRQLTTLGFALLVFMLTLFAQRLQAQYSRPSIVGIIGDRQSAHSSQHDSVMNDRDCTIALVASRVASH
jgi:hypothetical protein